MKLVIGNQKSYLTKDEVDIFIDGIKNIKCNNFIICPSNIYINDFRSMGIPLGSQNVSSYSKGATTGEVSCEQLKSIGVNYSIVGHSERREKLKESIEDTNIKIKKLLEHEMIPILCVGETLEQRDNGKTKDIISTELIGAFAGIDKEKVKKVIIAYEPIWAIGTGVVPSNKDIEDISKYIKDLLYNEFESVNTLLYGGSVNTTNIDELNKIDIIDGYLIGGASTKAVEILEIIHKCE